MELEQLEQLDAIEREGTMSAAARALHISQPALSRSIGRLEAELGQELFDRRGRRVELNEAGNLAVEWARRILGDERQMRDALDELARKARTLRVGTVAPAPLWRLTSFLVERFPTETLTSETLDAPSVERGVANGSLNFGILPYEPGSPMFRSCELMRESLSVTFPPNHPLASRRTLTAADLTGETFLILTNIGFWRGVVDAAIPDARFIELDDAQVFAQLARSTPYCTFMTDAPFMGGAPAGRAVVPISDDAAHANFHLCVRKGATDVVAGLFDWIDERR